MEKPYSFSETDSNKQISVYFNGKEVMRMIRKTIWHLYPVHSGQLIETFLIVKDQYRHDLMERIQLGHYDDKIPDND